MCEDCGCCNDTPDHRAPGHSHAHSHDGIRHTHPHDSARPHKHGHAGAHGYEPEAGGSERQPRTLMLHQSLLEKNERWAERNRGYFHAKRLLALNILSSPGSGKTALIERMLTGLQTRLPAAVIVGDLATDNDARRLSGKGAPVHQITTGTVCHLDAEMVAHALDQMALDHARLLIIENVGNLVCPAVYDLGEHLRVAMLSVTEGEDKPAKYPVAFKSAHAVLVSKCDLAEAAGFDRATALANIRAVAPQARIFELSARGGQGLAEWYAYLESALKDRYS